MNVEVRTNQLAAAEFQSLRMRCDMPPLDEELVTRALAGSLFTLSSYERGKLVGMLRVVGDGVYVFLIYDVLILPEFRRKGIGSNLIELALQRIESFLPEGMWITVNLFSAVGKEDFYKRRGFHTLPNAHFGAGMQMILRATGPGARYG